MYQCKQQCKQQCKHCVSKFSYAGCAACCVSETTRHFSTRVREHLETDRASHIFKHLEGSKECRSACSLDSFAIIDQTSSRFALKIKEALHILWEKPALNAQVKHVNLKLSVNLFITITFVLITAIIIVISSLFKLYYTLCSDSQWRWQTYLPKHVCKT